MSFADQLHEAVQSGGTSAGTDLGQVPALHKKTDLKRGSTNVDIGGGKSDKATKALAKKGVKNHVVDPFNRSKEHNAKASAATSGGKSDTATVANVLNVIQSSSDRSKVIARAKNAVGGSGVAYFSVYEGDGSGTGKKTPKGWQNNRKLASYVSEIKRHFKVVEVKGGKIVARQSAPKTESLDAAFELAEAERCTQFSLEAFGISDPSWTSKCVRTGADVLSVLREHGWKYQPLNIEGRVNARRFAKDHPKGSFVLSTRGHSMAVIDGKIHDFADGSGRSTVQAAVEVYKTSPVYKPWSTYVTEGSVRQEGDQWCVVNEPTNLVIKAKGKRRCYSTREEAEQVWYRLDAKYTGRHKSKIRAHAGADKAVESIEDFLRVSRGR